MPILESGEETLVGGQAVMEGVMMRAPHSYCVAVRKASGEIVTEEMPLARMSEKYKIFRYPIFRGVGTLVPGHEARRKALRVLRERRAGQPRIAEAGQESAKAAKEMPGWALAGRSVFSLAFFIFVYKFVPLWLATSCRRSIPALDDRIAFNCDRWRDPAG